MTRRPGPPVGGRADRGQATVELVLVLPVLVLALLLVVQVALVARTQVLAVAAAREGARAAAVDPRPPVAPAAARSTPGLDPSRLRVATSIEGHSSGEGSAVRVVVRYRAATDVPLVGALVGDPQITATVVMAVEDLGEPP